MNQVPGNHPHLPCPRCTDAAGLAAQIASHLADAERRRTARERRSLGLAFGAGILVALLARAGTIHAQEAPAPTPPASFWDRAVSTVSETADHYTSDEAVADYIVASVAKQARINKILATRKSSFRIADVKVVVSVPPALEVGVSELPDTAP